MTLLDSVEELWLLHVIAILKYHQQWQAKIHLKIYLTIKTIIFKKKFESKFSRKI